MCTQDKFQASESSAADPWVCLGTSTLPGPGHPEQFPPLQPAACSLTSVPLLLLSLLSSASFVCDLQAGFGLYSEIAGSP